MYVARLMARLEASSYSPRERFMPSAEQLILFVACAAHLAQKRNPRPGLKVLRQRTETVGGRAGPGHNRRKHAKDPTVILQIPSDLLLSTSAMSLSHSSNAETRTTSVDEASDHQTVPVRPKKKKTGGSRRSNSRPSPASSIKRKSPGAGRQSSVLEEPVVVVIRRYVLARRFFFLCSPFL